MIGIYKISNNINGKVYIGQSRCIERRWSRHKSAPYNTKDPNYNSVLYKSIRKNGIDNFTFDVVEECKIEQLNDREVYWIAYYNSCDKNNGYNITAGGSNAITRNTLSEKDIDKVIYFLKHTSKTQEEISKLFNVSQRDISGINLGQTWARQNTEYPIREQIKKKVYYCTDCGCTVTHGMTVCKKCSSARRRVVNRPDRETLKTMIRDNSFVSVGEYFNVSDNSIRKWCIYYNLPSKRCDVLKYTEKDWKSV